MNSYQKKIIGKSMDCQKVNLAENLDRNDRMYNYNRKLNNGDVLRLILGFVFIDFLFFGSYFLVFKSSGGIKFWILMGIVHIFDLFLLLINKKIKSTFLRYLFFIFHPAFFFLVNMVFIGFMYSSLGAYFYYYYLIILIGFFLLFVPYLISMEKCVSIFEIFNMKPEGHEAMTGEELLNATTKQKSYKWIMYPILIAFIFPFSRWFAFLMLFVMIMLFVAFQMRIASKKYKDQKKGLVPMDDFVALEAEMKAAGFEKLNEAVESENLEELEGLDGLEELADF